MPSSGSSWPTIRRSRSDAVAGLVRRLIRATLGSGRESKESGMPARIGLMIPSSNRMVEQEMVRHVPPGVVAHVTRLRMTGAHRRPLDAVLPRVEDATRQLTDARCDVVAFHCTSNSTSEGTDGEAKLLGALRNAGAPRATT